MPGARRIACCLVTGTLLALPAGAQSSWPARCGTGLPVAEAVGYVPLPRGDVFCPLVADPKGAHSFVSVLRESTDTGAVTLAANIASVGIGDMYGLGRWNGARAGDGVQFSLSAGVLAQFDLGTSSYDLLNADYFVGLPVTIRSGAVSARLRVYHQSSHLGDEYLLREPPDRRDRENLSFEAAEVTSPSLSSSTPLKQSSSVLRTHSKSRSKATPGPLGPSTTKNAASPAFWVHSTVFPAWIHPSGLHLPSDDSGNTTRWWFSDAVVRFALYAIGTFGAGTRNEISRPRLSQPAVWVQE